MFKDSRFGFEVWDLEFRFLRFEALGLGFRVLV
jgi:hypothetical protein